jgi:gluconokinase
MVVILMGVSGVGKTTVGREVSRRLGWRFSDGDEHHPSENVQKMAAGIPLTDQDRQPWLLQIRALIERAITEDFDLVVSCSALKASYRRVLTAGLSQVLLVYLRADFALIERRLAHRTGHFFDPALLKSQFDDLEEPESGVATVAADADLDSVVESVLDKIASPSGV